MLRKTLFKLIFIHWIGWPRQSYALPRNGKLVEQGLDANCNYRVDSVLGMHTAASEGFGLAVLPRYLGDSDSHLTCLSGPVPEIETEVWALTRPSMRQSVRILALMEFLAEPVPMQPEYFSAIIKITPELFISIMILGLLS